MPTPSGPRVIYVTSRFPYGPGESFLAAEVREVARRVGWLSIVPMRTAGGIVHADSDQALDRTVGRPLVSREIARAALAEFQRDRQQLSSLRSSRSFSIFLKNTAVAPKALWLARILRDLRVDHVHAHWGGASSTLAMVAAESAGVPWSLTLHRWDIAEDNLLREKVASAAFVRTISEAGACDVRKRVPNAQVDTIHMGVDVGSSPARRYLQQRSRDLRLLAVGSLVPVKGHDVLIEAIAALRRRGHEATLDLAGSGPLQRTLKRRADALGVTGHVKFLGFVPHDELLIRMHRGEWDVFVHPSVEGPILHEGIPVALMEAMNAGMPAVAVNSGGIGELVCPGTGILLPERSASSIADAIDLLESDPELARRLGAAARSRVAHAFNAAHVADQLADRFHATSGRLRVMTVA